MSEKRNGTSGQIIARQNNVSFSQSQFTKSVAVRSDPQIYPSLPKKNPPRVSYANTSLKHTPRKSTPVLPRSVVTILSEEMIETPTRKMDESVTSAAHGTDRMPQVCAEYGTRLERRNVVSFSPSLDARCSRGSRGREEHAWFAAWVSWRALSLACVQSRIVRSVRRWNEEGRMVVIHVAGDGGLQKRGSRRRETWLDEKTFSSSFPSRREKPRCKYNARCSKIVWSVGRWVTVHRGELTFSKGVARRCKGTQKNREDSEREAEACGRSIR